MSKGIIPIIVITVGLIVAVWFGFLTGLGDYKSVNFGIVMLLGIPAVMAMGVRSWYILPFGMLTASLPALPFLAGRAIRLSELSILFAAFSMLAVVAFGKLRVQVFHRYWVPLVFFFAWVIVVALANGVGLAVLGSSAMGGRRYLSVFLALIGMALLTQITMKEEYARKVLILILAAAAVESAYLVITTYIGMSGPATYEFYSWHQGFGIFALAGTAILFSRYSPREFISRPVLLLVYGFLLLVVIISAKRFAFAGCLAIPFISAFWNRQYGLTLLGGALAAIFLGGAIFFQNTTGALPRGMQRVLHFLPADWDHEVDNATSDIFRETLNRLAFEKIRQKPFIGEGVTLTVEDIYIMENPGYIRSIMKEGDDPLAYPHAAGKNWHSTWVGTAAILGIPGAVLWIFVQLGVVAVAWKLRKRVDLRSWMGALVTFCFISMVLAILRSVTSGDLTPMTMHAGLLVGLLCALDKGLPHGKPAEAPSPSLATPQPV